MNIFFVTNKGTEILRHLNTLINILMNSIGENTFNMNIHGYSNNDWYIIHRNKISRMMITLRSVEL